MVRYYWINQKITITNFKCKVNSDIQYYSKNTGKIKGIKKTSGHINLYLIEFLNHNRVWALIDELGSL